MPGSCGPTAAALLVGHVLAPEHGPPAVAGFVVLLHGDVDREAVRRGAVQAVLAGLEEHAVAGPDLLDRTAFAPAEADALGDEDRLPVRVDLPGGARAGREVHARGRDGGGRLGGGDRVAAEVAGEPVGGAVLGVDAAGGDLHVCVPVPVRSEVLLVAGRDEPQRGRPRLWTDHRLHVARVAAVLVAVGGVDGLVDVIAGLDQVDGPLDATRADAGGVAGLRGAEPAT